MDRADYIVTQKGDLRKETGYGLFDARTKTRVASDLSLDELLTKMHALEAAADRQLKFTHQDEVLWATWRDWEVEQDA
jgi:hypothetical protein